MAARVLAVEERRVDRGVTRRLVQLRREAQQHSPDRDGEPVERFDYRGVMRESGRFEADLPEYLWHFAQEVERDPVGLLEVDPETVE